MNRYECVNVETNCIKKCPCGKGGYESITKTFEDDFCREHKMNENRISCADCREKYEYYRNCWIPKDKYTLIKDNEKGVIERERKLYKRLYNEVLDLARIHLKTKKGLYNCLYENRLFNVPGTLQTFYKNGVSWYIDNGDKYYNLGDMIKLIDITIGFSDEYKLEFENIKMDRKKLKRLIVEYSA